MPEQLRSYRRVFNIDRRIYAIEGRQLPIPGGLPLRFIGWLAAGALFVAMVRTGAPVVMFLAIALGGLAGRRRADWPGAMVGAVMGWALFTVSSFVLSILSAPFVYVVVPFGLAMASMAAQPDGRSLHRFVFSFIAWQLAPPRTDGSNTVPSIGEKRSYRASECYLAPDWRSPILRAGTFKGEGELTFDRGARVKRRRALPFSRGKGGYVIRPAESRLRHSRVVGSLTLEPGEQAEVRP